MRGLSIMLNFVDTRQLPFLYEIMYVGKSSES